MQGEEGDEADGPTWAFILGLALIVLTFVVTVVAADDDLTSAQRLGYGFGSVVFPFSFAVIGRFLWVKLGSGRPPVLDPAWVLLTVGIIGFLVALSGAGRRAESPDRVDSGSRGDRPEQVVTSGVRPPDARRDGSRA